MHISYQTKGVCAAGLEFDIEEGVVKNINFMGGCDGNLKAIPILVDGWTVEEIEKKLSGVTCGHKGTSCADQLAKAVRAAYEAEQKQA